MPKHKDTPKQKEGEERVKNLLFARPNYFQGILQLRSTSLEVVDFVYKQLEKRKDVAITKKVLIEDGMDLYMTSQTFLRNLGKKLKESFGGEMKTSARLHTRRKGKDLYRVNVLYRPWKIKPGDIINVRGEEIRVVSFGNKVFGKEMKTGRRVSIRHSDLPRE